MCDRIDRLKEVVLKGEVHIATLKTAVSEKDSQIADLASRCVFLRVSMGLQIVIKRRQVEVFGRREY